MGDQVISVKYTPQGFPDFSPFKYTGSGTNPVTIQYSGNRVTDFAMANAAAGLASTPAGYTWHHVEDMSTMILVRTDVHKLFPHTGGFSLYKAGL